MREIKLHVKILRSASGLERATRVEPCHWSEGYVGVSLQERRATMHVMLGMSLRARWDATLVSYDTNCIPIIVINSETKMQITSNK